MARLVHRRTDHGEIEPLLRADVAVETFAQVERDAKVRRVLSGASALGIEARKRLQQLFRRLHCIDAHGLPVAALSPGVDGHAALRHIAGIPRVVAGRGLDTACP